LRDDPKSLKSGRRSCKVSYHRKSGDKKEGRMAQIQEKKMNSPKFITCHEPPVVEHRNRLQA